MGALSYDVRMAIVGTITKLIYSRRTEHKKVARRFKT